MFTGIIRYIGELKKSNAVSGGKRLLISISDKEFLGNLEEGITSIAINGVCHTVEKIESGGFFVFSSFETLERTNIGELRQGEIVNLELPLTMNTLLDGHLVLGHIDGVGEIINIEKVGEAYKYRFRTDENIFSYLVEKDSLAIDGISLTIFNIKNRNFEVAIIPETINKTNLKYKRVGSIVNLEINIFAKYGKKFLERY
ncbi:MAG: riboflavin synthase [Brevinematales bacterium]|nr:riboflavin synthase [Brevinematales bacterium]